MCENGVVNAEAGQRDRKTSTGVCVCGLCCCHATGRLEVQTG